MTFLTVFVRKLASAIAPQIRSEPQRESVTKVLLSCFVHLRSVLRDPDSEYNLARDDDIPWNHPAWLPLRILQARN
jgi:hypothetical protein